MPTPLRESVPDLSALNDSAAGLVAVLQSVREGVVMQAADGCIIASNAAAERILGLSADQMAGRTSMDPAWRALLANGDPLPGDQHPAMVTLRTGEPVRDFVMGVHRSDASVVWLRVNAVPFEVNGGRAVVATFTDITALHQAESALAERDVAYAALVAGLRDPVVMLDTTGAIQWASDAITPLLGLAADQLVGTPLVGHLHPDDRETPTRAALRRRLIESGVSPRREVRMRCADDSYRWLELTATPLHTSTGEISGEIQIWRDIHDQRQVEALLAQDERLRAIGTIAGGLAHDVNNVLAIIGTTAAQLREQRDEASWREDLGTILTAVERGHRLTRQVLTFARHQVRAPASYPVARLLQDNETLLRHLVRIPDQLVVRSDATEACVLVDRDEFGTALLNLVVNARDAMPDDGVIEIHADVVATRTVATPLAAAGDSVVRVRVIDHGTGMAPAVVARAFEPFFTTKPVGQGTGLGLSTVHGIMAVAQGAVTIDSQLGVGTTVTLWFPLSTDPTPAPVAPPPAHPSVGPRLRVLLVDDDGALRTMLHRVAATWGHEVVDACGAADALAMLEERGSSLDVLITDFAMPGGSGRTLIEQVRARWPHLTCILMSGYTADEATRDWVESGRVRFLEKPFTLAQLSEALRVAPGAVRAAAAAFTAPHGAVADKHNF